MVMVVVAVGRDRGEERGGLGDGAAGITGGRYARCGGGVGGSWGGEEPPFGGGVSVTLKSRGNTEKDVKNAYDVLEKLKRALKKTTRISQSSSIPGRERFG